ncbi:MAG: HD domain-containing protein [Planctomycetota bacterium]
MPWTVAQSSRSFTYGLFRAFRRSLDLRGPITPDSIPQSSNVPYITHLLAVASLVGEVGGTEDEVIAALLHDAVEDQGSARRPPRSSVGSVNESPPSSKDAPTPIRPQATVARRKEAYIRHLETADPSVRLVSAGQAP